MAFSAHSLLAQLQAIREMQPDCRELLIGYSGGMDSHVLLHALSVLQREQAPEITPFTLRALHINHGLSPHAASWQQHCHNVCAKLQILFSTENVNVAATAGDSLEEQARHARYAAFAQHTNSATCLLLAHHQDDQVETIMLRLLRGAGPKGLAAIPPTRAVGQGNLFRPLLEVSRQSLQDYAVQYALQWINDESNSNLRFDRNYLRQQVLPALASRWPTFAQSWQRSAQLCAEAELLLGDLAEIDLQTVSTQYAQQLDMKVLRTFSAARQRNILRYWLRRIGFAEPGWHILTRYIDELSCAGVDKQPELVWSGHVLRSFQHRLHALRTAPDLFALNDTAITLASTTQKTQIPLAGNGSLHISHIKGHGLFLPENSELKVTYRKGGEQCRLAGRRTRLLKKILHDAGVPPWLRDRFPILVYSGQIACLPGIGVSAQFAATAEQTGVLVRWQSEGEFVCG